MTQVLVVEPWYGGSHRAWADGWRDASGHEIALVTLPDRFWRWRLRGGAEALADAVRQHLGEVPTTEVVVVSGMVDVAALVGMCRRSLGDRPVVTYMHENQLLYPLAPNQKPDTSLGLTNWRSTVVADEVWWNSAFHRDAFIDAAADVLDRQPESTPASRFDALRSKSRVLAPGVETRALVGRRRGPNKAPLVVWNQRWDHDKNPDAVFGALARLADEGVAFEIALAGVDQGHPSSVDGPSHRLGSRIVHRGWLDRVAYLDLLVRCDVLVSAADHEFFGVAIVEAIAAGAVPVLPDRLSFPELIEPRWHRQVLYAEGQLQNHLRGVLRDVAGARRATDGLRESMTRFDISLSAAAHDAAIDQYTRGRG